MYRVPPWVIDALNSVTKRQVRLEWSNDNFATVDTCSSYSSEFTCDASSQVRWSARTSLVNPDDRINNVVTRVRAFLEIKGVRAQWVTIPMGVYRLDELTLSGKFADLTLSGYESYVQQHEFHAPRTFPKNKGDSRRATLTKLLRESLPNIPVVWLVREATDRMTKVTVDRDRWSLIDGDLNAKSITASMAADCYADRVGQFVVAPTPLETNQPVWEITVDSGVKVGSATTLGRENMVNVWSVWAEPGGKKKVIGPVHVWDNDKGSDTYAGINPIKYGARDAKPFGIVNKRYQNPILKSVRACEKVGRKRLALSLAQRRNVTISSIFNPTLDAGDCLALRPDGSKHLEGFILERVSYSIDDAYTEMTMRTQGPPAFAETAEDEQAPL